MTAMIICGIIGVLLVVAALCGMRWLWTWHGRGPTVYRAGEGTCSSPAREAHIMRSEKLRTRTGVELE